MKANELKKELMKKRGILVKHAGVWGLYFLLPDGSIGHQYAGKINPRTAEKLIKENNKWGKE